MYEACREQVVQHRQREEELARHAEDLAAEINAEREAREELEVERDDIAAQFNDLDTQYRNARREWEESARRERRTLDETESALTAAKHDLDLAKALLSQRESDIAEVQAVITRKDAESKRLGESASSDRFALNLELERLKRDLVRADDEIARLKKDLDERDAKARDREAALDKLHVENRDLAGQLATQTQARLNLSEKLDTVQANLKTAEAEVSSMRSKMADLETRLSKDQRSQLTLEHQYRDQLTERNTLLLTVYQYLDKILGVEKTAVRRIYCEQLLHLTHYFVHSEIRDEALYKLCRLP
jgi:chromosome segregation ATPase